MNYNSIQLQFLQIVIANVAVKFLHNGLAGEELIYAITVIAILSCQLTV